MNIWCDNNKRNLFCTLFLQINIYKKYIILIIIKKKLLTCEQQACEQHAWELLCCKSASYFVASQAKLLKLQKDVSGGGNTPIQKIDL